MLLRLLRIPLDFLTVTGAFLGAYGWRSHPEWIPFVDLPAPQLLPFTHFLSFSLQAAFLTILILAWERMYRFQSIRLKTELRKLFTGMGAAFTLIIIYFFLFGITFFSRFILGVAFLAALLLMVLHRLLLRYIQRLCWKRGIGNRRMLFIGQGSLLQELAQTWQQDPAFEIIGRLAAERRSVPLGELKILGTYTEIEQIVKNKKIDEILQVGNVSQSDEIVEFCQLNHVEYRFVPNMLEVQRTNTEIDFIKDIPLITLRSAAIDNWGRVVKRSVDVFSASLGLVLLSPLFLVIALGVKLNDPGPIFYRSQRVSRNKTFWMFKFRTMIVNADKLKSQLIEHNHRKGPLFKIGNDPRVTRFGRFLRRTTLDELPQLWNVLQGDLSLVGPRAHLPEEVAQYEKHHRRVLAIKAGVTGLPQISGRSRLDFEKEVKLDVYYIENWSLWMDIKIIFRTLGVMLEGE